MSMFDQEGPMAHSGSIIAAGIGKGRLRLPCGRRRVSVSSLKSSRSSN